MKKMYCLACDYDLTHLDTDRCPECGRAFNPLNPDTFAAKTLADRRAQMVVTIVIVLAIAGFVFGLGVLSWTIYLIHEAQDMGW